MYCRNCGAQIDDKAEFCIHCGVAPRNGNKFCPNCGSETPELAVVCVKCGILLSENKRNCSSQKDPSLSEKNGIVAFVLCFFLGCLGIHSFYCGKIGYGVAQLITCGGCGIWALIDLILIACGTYKDSEGKYVKLVV